LPLSPTTNVPELISCAKEKQIPQPSSMPVMQVVNPPLPVVMQLPKEYGIIPVLMQLATSMLA
jgi:hypothetical protein